MPESLYFLGQYFQLCNNKDYHTFKVTDTVLQNFRVKGSLVQPPEQVEKLRPRGGGPCHLSTGVPLSELVIKPVRFCMSW